MDKKIIFLFLFLFLFSLTFISAAQPATIFYFENGLKIVSSPQIYLQQNQNFQINFFVYNQTNGLVVDNSTVNCTYYLANNLGDVLYFANVSYLPEGYWGINLTGGNFSELIEYNYGIKCVSDEQGGTTVGVFEVTYTGKELSSASSTFYIILFTIFIFLFVMTLLGINKLPSSNATDDEGTIIKISYLKYLRPVLWFVAWMFIVGILYISSNLGFAYLEDTLFANFLFTLFKISFGLSFPIVIMWFVWIFARIVDDKKIKNLWSRGMFQREI